LHKPTIPYVARMEPHPFGVGSTCSEGIGNPTCWTTRPATRWVFEAFVAVVQIFQLDSIRRSQTGWLVRLIKVPLFPFIQHGWELWLAGLLRPSLVVAHRSDFGGASRSGTNVNAD